MEREACVCDHGLERSDLCAEIIIIIIKVVRYSFGGAGVDNNDYGTRDLLIVAAPYTPRKIPRSHPF